jgi:hypothetical protein
VPHLPPSPCSPNVHARPHPHTAHFHGTPRWTSPPNSQLSSPNPLPPPLLLPLLPPLLLPLLLLLLLLLASGEFAQEAALLGAGYSVAPCKAALTHLGESSGVWGACLAGAFSSLLSWR